jgi:putative inorganic carbon (hco3(-)) transporter
MSSFAQTHIPRPRRLRGDVLIASAVAVVIFGIMTIGNISMVAAAAVLLALVALGLARPEIATIATVFVIYSDLAAVAVRSHGLPKLFAISFFAILLLPVAYYVIGCGERLRTDTTLGLMLAYVAVQIASAMFARNMAEAMRMIASFVTEGAAVYFLLINAIRTPATLRRCLWAMLAAGVLLGSVSLVQNRTYRYDNDFGGLALTKSSTTQQESVIAASGDDDAAANQDMRARALGPIGDANFYAQLMVVLLPIAALRFWAERKRWARWIALAAIVPILGAVVLTFSRGAALAAMFLCVALIALRYMKLRHAIVPLLAAVVVIAMTPEYATRLSTLLKMRSPGMRAADASIQERSAIYASGFHIFLDHPLLGVGIGQAPEYLPEYSNFNGHSRLRRKMGAHNMYLESLAETGILGFSLLMAMVGVTLRRLLQLRRYWKSRNSEYAHTITSILLAIVVFLVTGLFLHLAYGRYFWLLLALAGAASAVYGTGEKNVPAYDIVNAERPPAKPRLMRRPRHAFPGD